MKKNPISSSLHTVKNYFTFSRGERRGFFILSIIIILLLAAIFLTDFLPKQNATYDLTFEKDVAAFEKQLATLKKETKDSTLAFQDASIIEMNQPFYEAKKHFELFPFNPNHLPAEQWKKLGLSEKQIHVIQNYENKGGKFYKKDDFKKMYCITKSQYDRMEPYISIPEIKRDSTYAKTDSTVANNSFVKKDASIHIDINIALAEDFQKLKGIGTSKANAIISYRNKLGGFTNTNQLLEVYGMNDTIFEAIKTQLEIKIWNIRKININSHDPSALKHPYINNSLARLIMNYRNLHGDFKSVEEIKKLALLNEEAYLKIAPYLDIK